MVGVEISVKIDRIDAWYLRGSGRHRYATVTPLLPPGSSLFVTKCTVA